MEKNPKACEPCRRRKIRCDGKSPCNRCDKKPEDCTYRLRTRVRKTAAEKAAAARAAASDSPDAENFSQPSVPPPVSRGSVITPPAFSGRVVEGARPGSVAGYSNVYQGVAAVYEQQGAVRGWPETSRLFYGPSSQFAFLQQLHRGLISSTHSGQADKEVQEGGAGLDLFLQRGFFFGTASRIDHSSLIGSVFPLVPIDEAKVFLDNFKAWNFQLLPFFTDVELDQMLENLYEQQHSRPSQSKALTVAILALGALATPHTNTAELLLAKAKYEAVCFDDTVSVQMIQFSLLIADYQTNLGRPNAVYLHLGTACRKAFALGLHREAANSLTRPEHTQKYRATLWSLYTLESWYSMIVGRETSLKMADISTPFPEDQDFLVSLSQLSQIIEKLRTTIYTQRYDSLRKLYQAAEAIHAQLRNFAEKHGIGGAQETENKHSPNPTFLIMYNLFYHVVLLTYRPFLVADFALASNMGAPSARGGGADAMWLRQACRIAIDSAQDQIVHANMQMQKHDACRTSRYNGYFLESSCAVLFFDILRHPSKYTYNVEYINMALQSLDIMIDDEPATNARSSIRQILSVVEDTIMKRTPAVLGAAPDVSALTDPLLKQDPPLPSPASFLGSDQPEQQPSATNSVPFPWLNAPEQALIYFQDLGDDVVGSDGQPFGLSMGGGAAGDAIDPLLRFNYDVMATDLYSFFPLNMSPPSAAGTSAGTVVQDGESRQQT